MHYKPQWGASALRDITTLTGTGAVGEVNGEIRVRTGATANSTARLETVARAAYVAGSVAQTGVGLRIPTAPTGSQMVEWGQFDSDNGFGFGWDATDFYVWRMVAGEKTKTYRSDWNVDAFDESGPTGWSRADLVSLVASGAPWHIDWTWYGYGSIVFSMITGSGSEVRHRRPIHVLNVDGLSLTDPNQPLTVYVQNGATASDFAVYVGGRQFSLWADVSNDVLRHTSADRSAVTLSTNWLPVLAVRRKSVFPAGGRSNSVRCYAHEMAALCGSDIELKLVYGGTVADGSWGALNDIDANETAIEMNASLTSHSGGRKVDHAILAGGSGSVRNVMKSPVIAEMGAQLPLVMYARAFTGTPSLVKCLLTVEERW